MGLVCLKKARYFCKYHKKHITNKTNQLIMEIQWVKLTPSLQKGISIINQFEEPRCEQFIKRLVSKLKQQDSNVFTEEERIKLMKIFKIDEESLALAIKTILYLFKRLLLFVFMPSNLKSDLKYIGFCNEKADCIVKVWSADTKTMLNDLGANRIEKMEKELNFSWKLNAELSSDVRKKSKVPKAYLSINETNKEIQMETTHPELYTMFLQFEGIQNELDNIL